MLPKHGVFLRESGFIKYEANSKLFSNIVFVLPLLVHLVRTCLVGAEGVEKPCWDEL